MSISANINDFKKQLGAVNVKLIAVSKTQPIEKIQEAYDAGQKIFGENQVQEMVEKHELLPRDIEWHLIGHLQTNKVKYIAPFVNLIHSVDSLKLLQEINKQAQKNNRVIDCLFQVYIADEETKYGLGYDELIELLRSDEYAQLKNIRMVGVMGIATNTNNQKQIKEEFYELATLFKGLKQAFFRDKPEFAEISMGMSGDYLTAIEQGSTMIRVGSAIFGERSKKPLTGQNNN
ncbi:YggS family pyridoxal phosphate-dependent enzyme [Solitalea lacus]|uniref:YggS family pyridoxal phosphate-dependent enzyme n=1 Tax=Solitalea lacus TaxID=2911172 RepID=UPI001EDC7873|nr:YggS family pyridoxal phosphate-dependent enzyme [Solitalea lacus]UKJ05855.1 YggS family pyridoxal phosphate-dependent enzyme [Solitalea lacus]